ncbi:HNH endonuclease [Celeribacter naphthalenivorans]|uniref:HNH endonuclease n=1 Tax=Celeribacter naphthalenivorans TaxID=1614694 RepID=UPI001CFBAF96|nr:HNH endonuclease [Celeribacter naphthalenivorans]
MGLKELGITKANIVSAMDEMGTFPFEGSYRSKKVFVIDPRNQGQVWDLKALVRLVARLRGVEVKSGFVTDTYIGDFSKLGFKYLRFDQPRVRVLGINGFDPEEFYDAHEVIYPDGTSRRFEAGDNVDYGIEEIGGEETPSFLERRVTRFHKAWERRGADTRKVKEIRGLTCEGCGLNAEAHFGRKIAMSCIEAHHLKPVAEMPVEGRRANPDDFAVLCASCHRIIHRLESPDDLEGLRAVVKGVRDLHTRFSKNKSG